jgi:hypothetical protein
MWQQIEFDASSIGREDPLLIEPRALGHAEKIPHSHPETV